MRNIKQIILHCSATPDYPISAENFDIFTASDIDRWHRERGWDEIGYHWVVTRAGKIEPGRAEMFQGAHCIGQNSDSIGICYIGSKILTCFQIAALYCLISDVMRRYKLDLKDVFPHSKYKKTACPGISIPSLIYAFLEIHTINLDNRRNLDV